MDFRARLQVVIMVVLQTFEKADDALRVDALQDAIASNCSWREGAGLKAKRPCRFRIMCHLDAGQRDGCRREGLEAQHRSHPTLDAPMVLFDPIIEVLALADADRFQCSPRPTPQAALGIARGDRFPVGLAAVDDDTIGSIMALQCLA